MSKTAPFAIQAGALRQALGITARVVERRNTIPILAHTLLEAKGGTLHARGTNMEQWLATTAQGSGDLPALTVAPGPLLTMLALLPPEETVELSIAAPGHLNFRAGTTRAKMFTLPPEDMPTPKEWKEEAAWTIEAGTLRTLLDRPFHAVSTEETRYYLNGIYLDPVEDAEHGRILRAVATDGHRIMLAHTPAPVMLHGAVVPMILPRLTISLMRPLLARLPPDTPLTVRQGQLHLSIAPRTGWTLTSKVIDGTFPDYMRVIPKPGGPRIQVQDSAGLARTITLTTALSGERSRPVLLSNGTGNTLNITNRSDNTGMVTTAVADGIAAWATNGKHPEVGFRARYLLDVCRTFRGGFTLTVPSAPPPAAPRARRAWPSSCRCGSEPWNSPPKPPNARPTSPAAAPPCPPAATWCASGAAQTASCTLGWSASRRWRRRWRR
jgi:DNA polymerase III subunit beta